MFGIKKLKYANGLLENNNNLLNQEVAALRERNRELVDKNISLSTEVHELREAAEKKAAKAAARKSKSSSAK